MKNNSQKQKAVKFNPAPSSSDENEGEFWNDDDDKQRQETILKFSDHEPLEVAKPKKKRSTTSKVSKTQ